MLKWHYPGNGGGIARTAFRPVGIATALEYNVDRIRSLAMRCVSEAVPKMILRDMIDEIIKVFLVRASRIIFPLISETFVVQIRIGKIEGWNATNEDLYTQGIDTNEAFE